MIFTAVAGVAPRFPCFFIHPQGEAAAGNQHSVISGPVTDAVLGFRLHATALANPTLIAYSCNNAYHRCSLAETTFFRCKTLFGPTLHARAFPQQATELVLKVAALNRMTHLGMPDSYRLAA